MRLLGGNTSVRRSRVVMTAGLTIALTFATSHARAGDAAAAREQLKFGYALAENGKCDEAIPRFQESLKLDPKAITFINLAQCEEKVNRLADALGHWVDARSRAQAEGNGPIEIEAETRAKALEPRLPRLTIVLAAGAPKGTEVLRDGVVLGAVSLGGPVPVNPGAHAIVVKAPGRKDTKAEVSIAEAEMKKIEVRVGEIDPTASTGPGADAGAGATKKGTSPFVYVGFGTAIAGVAVGTITGLMALGEASTAKDGCPSGECRDQASLDAVDQARTFGTISTIGFIVGGVGAAVGVSALVWGSPRGSSSVAVSVGPTGGVLRGSF